jgi:hypothetical protein
MRRRVLLDRYELELNSLDGFNLVPSSKLCRNGYNNFGRKTYWLTDRQTDRQTDRYTISPLCVKFVDFVYTGCGRETDDYKTIQTLYLHNYKNIILKYTTQLITSWTRRLQGDLHPCANTHLALSDSHNRQFLCHTLYNGQCTQYSWWKWLQDKFRKCMLVLRTESRPFFFFWEQVTRMLAYSSIARSWDDRE